MAFSEHLLRIGVKTTTPDPLGFRLKASIGNDAGPVPSRRPLPATRRAGGPIDGPARSVRLCDADTPIILARTALQSPRTENVSGVQPPTHDGIAPMVIDRPERSCLLTINGGSSTLKFALFPRTPGAIEGPLLKGRVERIGLADAQGGRRRRGRRRDPDDRSRRPGPAGGGRLGHRLAGRERRLGRHRRDRPPRRAWWTALRRARDDHG